MRLDIGEEEKSWAKEAFATELGERKLIRSVSEGERHQRIKILYIEDGHAQLRVRR